MLSGHNQYFLWGTHGYSGNVVIDVAGDCGAREHLFASSELARQPLRRPGSNPSKTAFPS